jgi:hypothetical protein
MRQKCDELSEKKKTKEKELCLMPDKENELSSTPITTKKQA